MRFRPKRAHAIDLDSLNQFEMLRRYFNARYLGKTVMVKRSPSGRGYHIHAKEGFTLHEAMTLGDCPGRLFYWAIQGYTFTFSARLDWRGRVTGREQTERVLALPFFSKVPRRWCKRWRRK